MELLKQIKASNAINWEQVDIKSESKTAGKIRKLYWYTIINHKDCLTKLRELASNIILKCLSQPVFAFSKQATGGYHNLIAVALCFDNLELAIAQSNNDEQASSAAEQNSVFTDSQFIYLFTALAEKVT